MASFESSGQKICYEERGEGRPILLLHAFMTSSDIWTPQVELLSQTHRVITLDWPGHGQSAPVSKSFLLEDLVEHVIVLLDHLRLERAIWTGVSMGGMVAIRAALNYASRVSGLVLMGTHAGPESLFNKLQYRALELGVRPLGLRPFLPAILPLMFGATARKYNKELVQEWRAYVAQLDIPSMVHTLDALMAREPLAYLLPSIASPTLVLVGEEDKTLPPAYAAEIANGISGARLIEITGAGHLVALERPKKVNPYILEFLNEIE